MDRGIKIAIFVASVVALCLGLIWDQVLSHARVMVEPESDDVLSGELIEANMGSPEFGRHDPINEQGGTSDLQPVSEPSDEAEGVVEPGPALGDWTEYTVQDGDSYWKLAHVKFKDRGLSSEDMKRANNGKELKPGDKFMVPPNKAALDGGTPQPRSEPRSQPESQQPAVGATEYIVKEGDSWWKIANVHFKGRGLTSDDLIAANPDVKLIAGNKVKIPAGK